MKDSSRSNKNRKPACRNAGSFVLFRFAAGLLVCFVLSGCCPVSSTQVPSVADTTYSDTVRQINERKAQRYIDGRAALREGNFAEAADHLRYIQDYKHAGVLFDYARARVFYDRQDYNSCLAYSCLERIPVDYAGPFADEIRAFRQEAEPRREEMYQIYYWYADRTLAEMKADEEGRPGWPHLGLAEEAINDTAYGPFDFLEEADDRTVYCWKRDGSVYYAEVSGGVILETGLRGEKKRSASGNSSSRKNRASSEKDPYNAKDYAHVDDFYYDHHDDFFDFEGAEDYYDDHS